MNALQCPRCRGETRINMTECQTCYGVGTITEQRARRLKFSEVEKHLDAARRNIAQALELFEDMREEQEKS